MVSVSVISFGAGASDFVSLLACTETFRLLELEAQVDISNSHCYSSHQWLLVQTAVKANIL